MSLLTIRHKKLPIYIQAYEVSLNHMFNLRLLFLCKHQDNQPQEIKTSNYCERKSY